MCEARTLHKVPRPSRSAKATGSDQLQSIRWEFWGGMGWKVRVLLSLKRPSGGLFGQSTANACRF